MAGTTTNISIRMDSDLKAQAEALGVAHSAVLIASRFVEAMRQQLQDMGFSGTIYKVVDYNTYADYSLSSAGSWAFIRIFIAYMIWKDGYREYQLALMESGWTYQDFRAKVSPPPYDR